MKEYNMDHELIYEGNYEGDRKNGFYRNGSGKEYRNGQLLFEGNWEKNIVNGYGVLYDDEGKVLYKGEWIKGWIGIDYGYYCKNYNRFYNHLPGYFFVCCDFLLVFSIY